MGSVSCGCTAPGAALGGCSTTELVPGGDSSMLPAASGPSPVLPPACGPCDASSPCGCGRPGLPSPNGSCCVAPSAACGAAAAAPVAPPSAPGPVVPSPSGCCCCDGCCGAGLTVSGGAGALEVEGAGTGKSDGSMACSMSPSVTQAPCADIAGTGREVLTTLLHTAAAPCCCCRGCAAAPPAEATAPSPARRAPRSERDVMGGRRERTGHALGGREKELPSPCCCCSCGGCLSTRRTGMEGSTVPWARALGVTLSAARHVAYCTTSHRSTADHSASCSGDATARHTGTQSVSWCAGLARSWITRTRRLTPTWEAPVIRITAALPSLPLQM